MTRHDRGAARNRRRRLSRRAAAPAPPRRPTSRQLAYLRVLANQTGRTYTNPSTAAQASIEINLLHAARRT